MILHLHYMTSQFVISFKRLNFVFLHIYVFADRKHGKILIYSLRCYQLTLILLLIILTKLTFYAFRHLSVQLRTRGHLR